MKAIRRQNFFQILRVDGVKKEVLSKISFRKDTDPGSVNIARGARLQQTQLGRTKLVVHVNVVNWHNFPGNPVCHSST